MSTVALQNTGTHKSSLYNTLNYNLERFNLCNKIISDNSFLLTAILKNRVLSNVMT